MSKNGNDPAYPQPANHAGYRAQWSEGTGGLTKREHMATEQMKGIISNEKSLQEIVVACSKAGKNDDFQRIVARMAITYADALLEELEGEHADD